MAIPRNFVPADWTKNANPRKYDPAVISTFTVFVNCCQTLMAIKLNDDEK